ncbi:hypothetical protein EZJ19_02785 [Parasulfuritortus cantonensis]|uniref:Uncharacterized protein n=1 Tax=Parasulfuritortus cantonensis TaxID=2528202 RepID=A0A4R1BLE7_9PROT|nr:hypothetical protein [Parasulfuritortus cantonensis]TCJ18179.1 hypothetical protein EZJ19_02785 [Parasulfuritortus cantonensis]
MDTLIACVSLLVSIIALAISVRFWQQSFRPIVTAAVKTHSGGSEAIHYSLVLMNSGAIPAKNVVLRANQRSLHGALGDEATEENRRRWLACFSDRAAVAVLQNGDRASCSFGVTKRNNAGFWKYKSVIKISIEYEGWFGRKYSEPQELLIADSDSFTGFSWG